MVLRPILLAIFFFIKAFKPFPKLSRQEQELRVNMQNAFGLGVGCILPLPPPRASNKLTERYGRQAIEQSFRMNKALFDFPYLGGKKRGRTHSNFFSFTPPSLYSVPQIILAHLNTFTKAIDLWG